MIFQNKIANFQDNITNNHSNEYQNNIKQINQGQILQDHT